MLRPETVSALRAGLHRQRATQGEATPELTEAIHRAAAEARSAQVQPEVLLLQLKQLADEVGLAGDDPEAARPRRIREWMVGAMLRAYWGPDETLPRS